MFQLLKKKRLFYHFFNSMLLLTTNDITMIDYGKWSPYTSIYCFYITLLPFWHLIYSFTKAIVHRLQVKPQIRFAYGGLLSLSSEEYFRISLWEEALAVCSWRRGHVEGTPAILAGIDKAVINQPNLGNFSANWKTQVTLARLSLCMPPGD